MNTLLEMMRSQADPSQVAGLFSKMCGQNRI